MKHSFFSILLMASAFACLPSTNDVLGTEFHTGNPTLASPANAQPEKVAISLSCSLPAPSSFDSDRTSGTTATLTWTTVPDAAAYRLIVRDLNTNQVVSSTLEYGSSKSLSCLEPSSTYRCELASVCLGNTASDFVIVVDIL